MPNISKKYLRKLNYIQYNHVSLTRKKAPQEQGYMSFFFFKASHEDMFLLLFRERGREGKREREKNSG